MRDDRRGLGELYVRWFSRNVATGIHEVFSW